VRQVIALVIIVGVVAGLAGGLTVAQLSGSAGAAPPPPAVTQVREQNLDGSGFIRVHEQGTANVAGTVNVGNLPAVQDVNVVSQPSAQGRLITLFMSPFSGSTSSSEPVDVGDCGLISITSRGGRVGPIHRASLDGTHFEEVDLVALGGTRYAPSDADSNVFDIPTVMPFLSVQVNTNISGSDTPEAWIWCEP